MPTTNPLRQLKDAGQSVWLDFLRRGLITEGGLQRLIDEDALGGVTSNPTIFGKAIGGSSDYDETISQIVDKGAASDALEIFYDLALTDIQMAADLLLPTYEASGRSDGFVSFELEPALAYDTQASISKAKAIFAQIGKPNVMIKVPGTWEGVAAVEELTAGGVNVNITLLFSVESYEQVALAYLSGLERRAEAGEDLAPVSSVASFFVSRVDSVVDGRLDEGSTLRGQIAIANAKVAYERFSKIFSGDRWDRLAAAGAKVQRPLWASTGTKDQAYSDVLYIEELVGPHTVNTIPQATMDAFRDHGKVRPFAVTEYLEEAHAALSLLSDQGIDLEEVSSGLLDAGIESFSRDMQKLLEAIEQKVTDVRRGRVRWSAALGDLEAAVTLRTHGMQADQVVSRMWRKDHTVWKPDPTEISDRLGWLDVAEAMGARAGELNEFASEVRGEGFQHAVLLGMGGSSLAPQVFAEMFGAKQDRGFLDLTVLDTTHPATIARLDDSLDLEKTLFIVASKSGGTIETLSHFAHYWTKKGSGDHFIAITDPGSALEAIGREHEFRRVFLNPQDIGGRYAALSAFGLVPAALIGVDVEAVCEGAEEMAHACREWMHPLENPGAWLGAVTGEAALCGRDKLTIILPPSLSSFGDWVEQLIAESTGKEGRGIVPVVGEDLGPPGVYGTDRLFVSIGEGSKMLDDLENAGHPVVRLAEHFSDKPADCGLGAEYFRFEFAAAVAGYVLSINPFDQPNVAEAKLATAEILEAGEIDDPGLDDPRSILGEITAGDYVCLQAYLDRTPQIEGQLQRCRLAMRDKYRVATAIGFGPRFLHSTGQLHKGGPDSGVFVQLVDSERSVDVPIPGRPSFTFGQLIDAQALGDLRSLKARGRRVIRTSLARLMETLQG